MKTKLNTVFVMLKRTTIFTTVCIALVLSLGLSVSQAQIKEGKIGYVNPTAILQKMPEFKAVQQRLQNFVEKKQKELDQKDQNLQDQIATYQQKQSVISEEAKKKAEERLGKLQADLQKAPREIQDEITAKQEELVGPLYAEITKGINAVAKRKGLNYVLNTTTNSGDLIILYASEEAQQQYDITKEVMDELDIGN